MRQSRSIRSVPDPNGRGNRLFCHRMVATQKVFYQMPFRPRRISDLT
jgi:hypothetical protein